MMSQEELNAIEKPGHLVSNQQIVEELQQALISAPQDIATLRGALRRALTARAWEDRLEVRRGRRFTAASFRKFIHEPLPEGLDSTEDTIRRLIADDPELTVDFEAALRADRGGNNNPEGLGGHTGKTRPPSHETNGHADPDGLVNVNIINIDKPPSASPPSRSKTVGTSKGQAIRRLIRAAEGVERKDPSKSIPPDPKAAELLELVRRGEISANRAMKEMGWRRDKTPLQQLRHWWGKASEAERNAFVDEIGSSGWSPT